MPIIIETDEKDIFYHPTGNDSALLLCRLEGERFGADAIGTPHGTRNLQRGATSKNGEIWRDEQNTPSEPHLDHAEERTDCLDALFSKTGLHVRPRLRLPRGNPPIQRILQEHDSLSEDPGDVQSGGEPLQQHHRHSRNTSTPREAI